MKRRIKNFQLYVKKDWKQLYWHWLFSIKRAAALQRWFRCVSESPELCNSPFFAAGILGKNWKKRTDSVYITEKTGNKLLKKQGKRWQSCALILYLLIWISQNTTNDTLKNRFNWNSILQELFWLQAQNSVGKQQHALCLLRASIASTLGMLFGGQN